MRHKGWWIIEATARQLVELAHQVQSELGYPPAGDQHTPLAQMFDSMGLVEFLLAAADQLDVNATKLERAIGQKTTTIATMVAFALTTDVVASNRDTSHEPSAPEGLTRPTRPCALVSVTSVLPRRVQTAAEIDVELGRPNGWWEQHTGNLQRRIWEDEDPVEAAAQAGHDCIGRAGIEPQDIDLLLVVSEAPPLLAGFGAAVHGRLGLSASVPAIEIGNACVGFLAALRLASSLLEDHPHVLIVCVEAPSKLLNLQPGAAGETAALFGDGAAACLVTRASQGVQVLGLRFASNVAAADLIDIGFRPPTGVEVRLRGTKLTAVALEAMTKLGHTLLSAHQVAITDLQALVMHAGNGRFPGLLARKMSIPPERIASQTAFTGNLGSASLLVAEGFERARLGPVLWTAVGAGLTAAAMLTRAES